MLALLLVLATATTPADVDGRIAHAEAALTTLEYDAAADECIFDRNVSIFADGKSFDGGGEGCKHDAHSRSG